MLHRLGKTPAQPEAAAAPAGYGRRPGPHAWPCTIAERMEINGLTGMTWPEPLSLLLSFLLFGLYVTAEAGVLGLFYMTSRPRQGRVRTAAAWHFAAVVWFMGSIIALGVWAAPAEKSFVDDATFSRLFPFSTGILGAQANLGTRFAKVEVSVIFFLLGVACAAVGVIRGGRQRRHWQRASVPAI